MVVPRHFHGGMERNPVARVRLIDPMAIDQTPPNEAMTGWRPGDERADAESMLRVDQAGEYGATRIYAGQLAVLRANCPEAKLIARMAAQEERHLKRFNTLMAQRRGSPGMRGARKPSPAILSSPLWMSSKAQSSASSTPAARATRPSASTTSR